MFNFSICILIDDDEADEIKRIESEEEQMHSNFIDDDTFPLDDYIPPNPYLSPQPHTRPDENFVMAIECDDVIEISSDEEGMETDLPDLFEVKEEPSDDEEDTPPKKKKVTFGYLYVYNEIELQNSCGPFAVSDKKLNNLYPRDGFHAWYFQNLVYEAQYLNFYM